MNRLTLDYWKSQLGEIFLENIAYVHKGKNIDEAIGEAYMHLISDPQRLENADASDFRRLVNSWLSNKRPEQKREIKQFKL